MGSGKDLKGLSQMDIVPGRGNNKGQALEIQSCLLGLKNYKKAKMLVNRKYGGNEGTGVRNGQSRLVK